MSRVLTLADLTLAARDWRADGAVIVLAAGVFDPLHAGHVQHLKAARGLGNVLVVAVTADLFVNKGPNRPRAPAEHRAEVVAALRCVDAVIVNPFPTACGVIAALRPHVFVKGAEYRERKTENVLAEEDTVTQLGGRMEFLSGRLVCSSTAMLAGV